MDACCVSKRAFKWANRMSNRNCKNQNFVTKEKDRQFGLNHHTNICMSNTLHALIFDISGKSMGLHVNDWNSKIYRHSSRSGNNRNKHGTYRLFKFQYTTQEYCKVFLPPRHRSAFAKFRGGTAPIRIETGRFENLEVIDRVCPFCNSVVIHVILHCDTY